MFANFDFKPVWPNVLWKKIDRFSPKNAQNGGGFSRDKESSTNYVHRYMHALWPNVLWKKHCPIWSKNRTKLSLSN
jgi:hypothetical protein